MPEVDGGLVREAAIGEFFPSPEPSAFGVAGAATVEVLFTVAGELLDVEVLRLPLGLL